MARRKPVLADADSVFPPEEPIPEEAPVIEETKPEEPSPTEPETPVQEEPETPAEEPKPAEPEPVKRRGRPKLSDEEKQKRKEEKAKAKAEASDRIPEGFKKGRLSLFEAKERAPEDIKQAVKEYEDWLKREVPRAPPLATYVIGLLATHGLVGMAEVVSPPPLVSAGLALLPAVVVTVRNVILERRAAEAESHEAE